jgi:amino acid transporter
MMMTALAGIAGIFGLMTNTLLLTVIRWSGRTPNATLCATTAIPQLTVMAAITALIKFAMIVIVIAYCLIMTCAIRVQQPLISLHRPHLLCASPT